MQDHDDHNDHGASAQASFVPKFHNNTFHRMLYDELAPEDDSIEQLEQSLRNTDPVTLFFLCVQNIHKHLIELTYE